MSGEMTRAFIGGVICGCFVTNLVWYIGMTLLYGRKGRR